jgi:hypothetical protein
MLAETNLRIKYPVTPQCKRYRISHLIYCHMQRKYNQMMKYNNPGRHCPNSRQRIYMAVVI